MRSIEHEVSLQVGLHSVDHPSAGFHDVLQQDVGTGSAFDFVQMQGPRLLPMISAQRSAQPP